MSKYGYVTENVKNIKPRFYVYSNEYRDLRTKLYDYGYDYKKTPVVLDRNNRIISGVFTYNAIKDGYGDVDLTVNRIRLSVYGLLSIAPILFILNYLPFNKKITKFLIDKNLLPKNYESKRNRK